MSTLRWIGWRLTAALTVLVGLEVWLSAWGGYGRTLRTLQDARLGSRMVPSQDVSFSWALEFPIHVNSYGFRDREWAPGRRDLDGTPLRDPGLLRVAVVGNSLSFGTGVAIEETWPRQLEALLAESLRAADDRRQALVMNFACEAYVLEQMARCYEDEVRPFRPDIVIFALSARDVTPMRPSVDEPDYAFRDWIVKTALYDFLYDRVINRWLAPPPSPSSAELGELQRAEEAIRRSPYNQENRRYWTAAAERLAGVQAELAADGGRLMILSMPHVYAVVVEPGAPTPGDYWGKWAAGRGEDPEQPGRLLVAHTDPTARFAAEMAPLAEELRGRGWTVDARGNGTIAADVPRAASSLFLLADTGHYSPRGHALLAAECRREIEQSSWSRP
jgi:hypothetical protein